MAGEQFDLSALQGLLGMFAPSEEDKQRAKMAGITQFGLGLLGTRKGQEFQNLGQAGAYGLQARDQSLHDTTKNRYQQMQTAQSALGLQETMRKTQDEDLLRKQQLSFGQQFPPSPQAQAGVSPKTAAQFGAEVPPNVGMSNLPPAQVQGPTKREQADKYRQMGDYWQGLGRETKAKGYYDAAEKLTPKRAATVPLTDPNTGKRVMVNIYDDGTREVLPDVGPDAEKPHIQDTGGGYVALDPFTAKPIAGTSGVKTQTPDSMASNRIASASLAETRRHHQVLEGDPAEIEATAKAIAAGHQSPLGNMAQSTPRGMAIMGRVQQINPEYNAQDYGTQQKALKDFASGKQGNAVRSFNVAISHLDTLGGLADALNTGNLQAVNKAANFYKEQSGQAAPTNFNAAKKIVADEIVKAIVGSGGGVQDREEAAKTIQAANSPAQLKGVINTYKELMKGQLGGLRQQYETSTNRKDFDRYLSGPAQAAVSGHRGPPVGTVVDGRKFKGGDPNKQDNWE